MKRTPSTTIGWILQFSWGSHCTSLKKTAVKCYAFTISDQFQLALMCNTFIIEWDGYLVSQKCHIIWYYKIRDLKWSFVSYALYTPGPGFRLWVCRVCHGMADQIILFLQGGTDYAHLSGCRKINEFSFCHLKLSHLE